MRFNRIEVPGSWNCPLVCVVVFMRGSLTPPAPLSSEVAGCREFSGHQSALPVGHDRYVALAAPALGSAEAHRPFADVVALRPHRGAQLGARGDAERGARRVVGLELGQELV